MSPARTNAASDDTLNFMLEAEGGPDVESDGQELVLCDPRTRPGEVPLAAEVKKSNALTEWRYYLGARPQKLLLYAISQIDPADLNLDRYYLIHATDFAEWAQLDEKSVRRDFFVQNKGRRHLVSLRDELMQSFVVIPNQWSDVVKGNVDRAIPWFQEIQTQPEQQDGLCDWVVMKFNSVLAPWLHDVQKNYYRVKRVFICRFESRFTIRLYEWIESWSYQQGWRNNRFVVSIDDLRDILGTNQPVVSKEEKRKSKDAPNYFMRKTTLYKRTLVQFSQLREKALDVAVREINEHTNFHVSTSLETRGSGKPGVAGRKAVTAVIFEVRAKTAEEMAAMGKQPAVKGSKREMVAKAAGSENMAEQMTLTYLPDDRPADDLARTESMEVVAPPDLAPAKEVVTQGESSGAKASDDEGKLAGMIVDVLALCFLADSQGDDLVATARDKGKCNTTADCAAYIEFQYAQAKQEAAHKEQPEKIGFFFLSHMRNNWNGFRPPSRSKEKPPKLINPLALKSKPLPPTPAAEITPVVNPPDAASEDEAKRDRAARDAVMRDYLIGMHGKELGVKKYEERCRKLAAGNLAAEEEKRAARAQREREAGAQANA